MCPKDVVDIPVPRRDDEDKQSIPKLEIEKDTLDPNIIIGGEGNQIRTSNKRRNK